jgi:hypothetical protein
MGSSTMSNESRSELREDQPLESTENDRLGYSFFAEELAQTITSRTPSILLACTGRGGLGKARF